MKAGDVLYWLTVGGTLGLCGFALAVEGSDAGRFAILGAVFTTGLAFYLVDWE